jgi:hypothetical protein
MRTLKVLGVLAALLLATVSLTTSVAACPAGYVPCGGACCPGR